MLNTYLSHELIYEFLEDKGFFLTVFYLPINYWNEYILIFWHNKIEKWNSQEQKICKFGGLIKYSMYI